MHPPIVLKPKDSAAIDILRKETPCLLIYGKHSVNPVKFQP